MLEEPSVHDGCRAAPSDMDTDDVCWICLDDTKDVCAKDPLFSPCSCPRKVHPRCLARWQLQQAGRLEETNCRFCHSDLADWKVSLTPDNLKPDVQRVQPIMVVYFEGQIHRIPVKQGPDGLTEFTLRIRELFRLPEDVDISLTFGCKEPLSGQHLKLEGIGAFDAAVHCASVAAAERQHKLKSEGGAPLDHGSSDGSGGGAAEVAAPGGSALTLGPNGETIGSSEEGGERAGADGGASAQPYPHLAHQRRRQQQLLQQQQQQHDPACQHDTTMTSASAPASAHTSGGGEGGGGGDSPPLLHPAASAPALSQLLRGDAGPMYPSSAAQQLQHQHAAMQLPLPSGPGAQQQQHPCHPHPGCSTSSLSDAASAHTSARTSSGGGGGGAAAAMGSASGGVATPPRRPAMGSAQQLLQFQADQRPMDGSPPPLPPPPALTAAAYPPLPGLFTPFQATAGAAVGGRYADVLARAPAPAAAGGPADGGPLSQQQQQGEAMQAQAQHFGQQQQQQPQAVQQSASALRSHGASMSAVGPSEAASAPLPLANALSEPFAAAATSAARVSPDAPHTPGAAQPPPPHQHAYGQVPPYHAAAPPYSLGYPQYPAMYGGGAAGSPYAAPPLPPLPPSHFLRPASPPSPRAAAGTPLTPRDHYDAPAGCRYTHQHPNHPNHNQQPPHQAHSQQHPLLPSYPSPDPLAGGAAPGAPGPATPVRPIARRTSTAPLPRSPPEPAASAGSPRPSSSPTASTPTANGWYGGRAACAADTPLARFAAAGCGPLQAGMMLAAATAASPTAGGAAAAADADADGGVYGTANRNRARRASTASPCSEPDMAVCVPSPQEDEAGAPLGSLTGRLKFSLRAFSRKVARSLSFQRGAGPAAAAGALGGAAAPCAGGGLLTTVAEAERAAWPGAGAGLGAEVEQR